MPRPLRIKSKSPMPVGTLLKFEFQLKDESRLIHGVGRVVWKRDTDEADGEEKPPGMGIKFIKMDPQSRQLVEQIVSSRGDSPGAFEQGRAKVRSQKATEARDARIILLSPRIRSGVGVAQRLHFGVDMMHCAELEQHEALSVETHALLPEDHRTRTAQADDGCDDRHGQREHQQCRERADDIERALGEMPPAVEGALAHRDPHDCRRQPIGIVCRDVPE